jgi:hypothetical protein
VIHVQLREQEPGLIHIVHIWTEINQLLQLSRDPCPAERTGTWPRPHCAHLDRNQSITLIVTWSLSSKENRNLASSTLCTSGQKSINYSNCHVVLVQQREQEPGLIHIGHIWTEINQLTLSVLWFRPESKTSVPECYVYGHLEGMGRLPRWQAADSDSLVRSPTPIGMACT